MAKTRQSSHFGGLRPDQRQRDPGAEPARRAVVQRQRTAMGLRDRARDREAEAETGAVVHSASIVAAHKGVEHLRLAGVGNSGPVAFYRDAEDAVADS